MKKNLRRALCVALSLMMVVIMLCGCKKSSAASMADVMKDAVSLDKSTFKTTIDFTVSNITASVELSGKTDGKATSIDARVSASGMNFKFTDLIVYTDDVIYFNVGEVLSQIEPFMEMAGYSLDDLNIDYKYISFESKGLFAKDTSFIETVLDDIKDAYKDNITEKDGKYTMVIDDAEDVKSISEETSKIISDNSSDWADKIYQLYTSKDMDTLINDILDDCISAFTKASKKMGMDTAGINKNEIINSYLKDSEGNDINDVSKDSIKKELDEAAADLKDCDINDIDLDNTTATITASESKNTYTFSIEANSTEGGNVKLTSEVKSDSSVKVSVPSDSDVTPLEDVLVPFFELVISLKTLDSMNSLSF